MQSITFSLSHKQTLFTGMIQRDWQEVTMIRLFYGFCICHSRSTVDVFLCLIKTYFFSNSKFDLRQHTGWKHTFTNNSFWLYSTFFADIARSCIKELQSWMRRSTSTVLVELFSIVQTVFVLKNVQSFDKCNLACAMISIVYFAPHFRLCMGNTSKDNPETWEPECNVTNSYLYVVPHLFL